jgi:hypothetical protein
LLRVLYRQHLKQQAIYDGENGGICADPKRKGDYSYGCEARALPQLPHGET